MSKEEIIKAFKKAYQEAIEIEIAILDIDLQGIRRKYGLE